MYQNQKACTILFTNIKNTRLTTCADDVGKDIAKVQTSNLHNVIGCVPPPISIWKLISLIILDTKMADQDYLGRVRLVGLRHIPRMVKVFEAQAICVGLEQAWTSNLQHIMV